MQQTNTIIIGYRVLRILTHTLVGILLVASIWPFVHQRTRAKHTQWWCKKLLSCFNIQIVSYGKLPDASFSNTMFIANHISWIDIHALNTVLPLQFIAKSDINNWPVFGYLVRKSGTIFINRNNRQDTARIVETIARRLMTGANVGLFPEGTTSDGSTVRHFKSSIVEAAIQANACLYPVAIRYPDNDGQVNLKMAYAGETTLGESVMNVLKQKESTVELHFLAAINPEMGNRQTLTQSAFDCIAMQLNHRAKSNSTQTLNG
ncbi:MAG: lysophospholipid acyltransferase family protein [Methylophilaceae bacterium]|nr:lysophospholipid acyltransferase family protein [Methylophilaceae bacterium]MDG1821575.1 lysophospholipid acyltransferase family protein [Methylophilaceae bacterium]